MDSKDVCGKVPNDIESPRRLNDSSFPRALRCTVTEARELPDLVVRSTSPNSMRVRAVSHTQDSRPDKSIEDTTSGFPDLNNNRRHSSHPRPKKAQTFSGDFSSQRSRTPKKGKEKPSCKEEEIEIPQCCECEDQVAEVVCEGCDELYCQPCWGSIHRRGKRSEHHSQPILGKMMAPPSTQGEPSHAGTPFAIMHTGIQEGDMEEDEGEEEGEETGEKLENEEGEEEQILMDEEPMNQNTERSESIGANIELPIGRDRTPSKEYTFSPLWTGAGQSFDKEDFLQRCKYIPLRLSTEERGLLTLLQASLNVSEYTDEIDTLRRYDKAARVTQELKRMLALCSGMKVCNDVVQGSKLLQQEFRENAGFFQRMFEVGRRHKIMNPEKMRATYGKLMYMLQDSQHQDFQGGLGLSCVKEIQLVTHFLRERGGLALLSDPRLPIATGVIHNIEALKSRTEIEQEIQRKNRAIEELKRDYVNLNPSADASGFVSDVTSTQCKEDSDDGEMPEGALEGSPMYRKPLMPLTEDDIQRVLDSISDANNYLAFNMAPVEAMLKNLENHFKKNSPEGQFSLSIGGSVSRLLGSSKYFSGGSLYSGFGRSSAGAKLNHDHSTQFVYVYQSLMLWKEIMANMFKLWYFADQDLLSGYGGYHLANTGQGLNRVQSCPNVSREMRRILSKVQKECGPWVGLSVVHLGDRDVPNALMFIDKYTQVPRILAPIVSTLDEIDRMVQDQDFERYLLHEWESPRDLKMEIMSDFFKHGFDGDGDDGGSCIDGRLTSAWNWCSKLGKKKYYHVFMFAGFQGFDGNWKD